MLSYFFRTNDLPKQLNDIKNLLAEIADIATPFFFCEPACVQAPQVKVTTKKYGEILWGENGQVGGATQVIENIEALFNIYLLWEQYKRRCEKLITLGNNDHTILSARKEFLAAKQNYRENYDRMEYKLANIQRSVSEYIRQLFLHEQFVFAPEVSNSSLSLLNDIKKRKELFHQFVKLRAGDKDFFKLLDSMHEHVVKKTEAKIQQSQITENSHLLSLQSSYGSH